MDERHCDIYGVRFPGDDGELVVAPDQEPTRCEPSLMGAAMESERPGSYWPHYNGYSIETAPHREGECEAHRPIDRWRVAKSLSEMREKRSEAL